MSSSTFFSILIILSYLQIISVINGLEVFEVLDDNSTTITSYDTNPKNAPPVPIDVKYFPQKAILPPVESNPGNLQIAIPTHKSYAIHPGLKLSSLFMNKQNDMVKPISQIPMNEDQSIEEIPRDDLSEEQTIHYSPELIKRIQTFAKYYFYQDGLKKKFLTGSTDPLTPTDFNHLVPVTSRLSAGDGSTALPSKNSYKLSELFNTLYQNPSGDLPAWFYSMLKEQSAKISESTGDATTQDEAEADGNLSLIPWNKQSANFKPDQQIALRGDHQIEEIPTNSNSKLSKFFQTFMPYYNHGTNTGNLASTGNTNPMSVSMNSNQQTPDNTQRLFVKMFVNVRFDPDSVLSIRTLSGNQKKSGLLSPTMSQSSNDPNPLKTIKTADSDFEDKTDVTDNQHLGYTSHLALKSGTNGNHNQQLGYATRPALQFGTNDNYNELEAAITIETVMNDIDAVAAQFNKFTLWDAPVTFMEHADRAAAFIICCRLDTSSDEKALIKEYVDTYHSLSGQMDIINKCAAKLSHSSDESTCKASLEHLKNDRKTIEAIIDASGQQPIDKNELMQSLDKAIQQSSDVQNVVYNYDSAVKQICRIPGPVLLWEPNELIRCEIEYRLIMLKNFATVNAYDKFNKEISQPFQQKALDLMISAKNAWMNIVDQIHTKSSTMNDNKSTSKDQIEDSVHDIKNKLPFHYMLFEHPMIAYYAKYARSYGVCCRPIETPDMLKRYIAASNINDDSEQDYAMDELLNECVHPQSAQDVNTMTANDECTAAYDDFTNARNTRKDYIKKYGKENPDIIRNFKDVARLDNKAEINISNMAKYVKKYCPNQHVLELMFDPSGYFGCERLIRRAVKGKQAATYQYYDSNISKNFQKMLQKSWNKIKQAVNDANRGTNIVHSSILPGPVIDTSNILKPSINLGESLSLANDASSMVTIISQCFSIILMLLIQVIFF